MLNAHRHHIQKDQNENGNFKSEIKITTKMQTFVINLINTICKYMSCKIDKLELQTFLKEICHKTEHELHSLVFE